MIDCVDYIIEASNDDKLSFLETIEAVSRSHRDCNSIDTKSFSSDTSSIICPHNDFSFISNFKSNQGVLHETNTLSDDDYLNMTECDLNILVDPKTGEPLFEEELPEEAETVKKEDVKPILITPMPPCEEELANDTPYSEVMTSPQPEVTFSSIETEKKINFISSQNLQPQQKSQPIKSDRVVLIVTNPSTYISKQKSPEECLLPIKPPKQPPQQTAKYDKPPFSYSCLIAMALKNSERGYLPVSEIYNYIINKFPYFKTAPDGWKNSIRHNLSLNKCFQKLESPSLSGTTRKACLWGLNESKISRLNEEIAKWVKKSSVDEPATRILNKLLDADVDLTNPSSSNNNINSPDDIKTQNQPLLSINKNTNLHINSNHNNDMKNSPTTSSSSTSIQETKEFSFYRFVKVPKCEDSVDVHSISPIRDSTIQSLLGNQDFTFEDILDGNDLKSFNQSNSSSSSSTNQRSNFPSRMNSDPGLSFKAVRASA